MQEQEFEVSFCELCGTSVPASDLASGDAVTRAGKVVGQCCLSELRGESGARGGGVAGAAVDGPSSDGGRLMTIAIVLLAALAGAVLFLDSHLARLEGDWQQAREDDRERRKADSDALLGVAVKVDGAATSAQLQQVRDAGVALEARLTASEEASKGRQAVLEQELDGLRRAVRAAEDRIVDYRPLFEDLRQRHTRALAVIEGLRDRAAAKPVAAAAATGFGVMAAELTAVRLFAPHFGDSAYVWTNVIGVILAAMAIGAALGGRLGAREAAEVWPGRLLLTGALLLALGPLAASWLGDALVPDNLALDAAMPALIRGSLVATAVVFAPPLLLLSAVSPLLVTLRARAGAGVGRAAGDIAAAGTVGSLLGTFLATHWLVPSLGCRLALLVSAGVLLLGAVVVADGRRRRAPGLWLLAVFGSSWLHGGPLREAPDGAVLLAERETPYQYLQVQRRDAPGGAQTTLVINEGLDSFHSLWIDGSVFTGGAYYDWHGLAPLLAREDAAFDGLRALSIGDAAGTLRRIYAALYPGVSVDAVDIDQETMALGDTFFRGEKASGERFAMDGRQFLANADATWDVIHVDAYAHQVYVPAHLASREFFEAARARLSDGGVLACNVGALRLDDAVLRAIAGTMAAVFGEVRVLLVPNSRNALVVARQGRAIEPGALAEHGERGRLDDADRGRWQDMLAHACDASKWHALDDAGPVLCDDQPLLDELLFVSYVAGSGDPDVLLVPRGQDPTTGAEQAAFEANQAGDHEAVFRAVEASAGDSAYLRLQAGDARWYRRQLRSAAREYAAGLAQCDEPALRRTLEAREEALRRELDPLIAADVAAVRNGWLGAAAVAAGAVLAMMLFRL